MISVLGSENGKFPPPLFQGSIKSNDLSDLSVIKEEKTPKKQPLKRARGMLSSRQSQSLPINCDRKYFEYSQGSLK